jgi:iron complex outermembrane receptor protein
MKSFYLVSTGLAAILAAAPASAQQQDASGPTPAPAEQSDGGNDQEIIVTAQKREQNVQDVPLSVTAVSGERLAEAGVSDISTLQKLAPGLQFGQSGNDARPAIRGARTESISNQTDPIISFFVDGIYRSRTSQALAAFVDVNRVEVLRGPQGTLYGRNSFGGAINLISNAPVNDTRAGATLTLGNYRQVRAEGFVNVPLTDTLFARFTASYDTHDPYVRNTLDEDNGLFDKDDVYLRGQLRWEPTPALDMTLRGSLWRQSGNGGSDFGYFVAGIPIDPNGGTFTFSEVINAKLNPINPRVGAGINTPADASPYRIARDAPFDLDTEQRTLDFEANYDFGPVAAKLLIGYADFETYRSADADLSIQPSGFEYQLDEAKTFTQELQLSSTGDGPLQWTVGAFHLTDKTLGIFAFDRIFNTNPATNLPILTSPAPTADFNSLADVDTDSLAFYGQATFSLTDYARITGGIRWTRDEKDFSRLTNATYTQPLVFSGTPFTDSETFKKVTWRAAAEFDLTPDNLIYASVATGFQAGGFNSSANTLTGSAAFGPQNIRAYEIGSKNAFLDGRLTANLALYLNEFRGLLANQFINVGTTVLTVSANAGAARARGAELELAWRASDDLRLSAGLTYNDAEFGNYILQEPVSGVQQNLRGEQVPFTPDWTGRLGAEYRIRLAGGASLTPSTNIQYSSSFSTNDFDYVFGRQDSYAKVDLSLKYSAASDRWWLQAFGNNITDIAVITRTIRFGQNAIVRSYAAPATYGVRLGVKF